MTSLWCYAVYYSFQKSPQWRVACGACISTFGIILTWYSARVAYAQIHYQRLKYREPEIALQEAHQQSVRLQKLYPHNYHLSQWMAETAYYTHTSAEIADYWVRIGVRQNPHKLSLRWIETLLVGVEADDSHKAARMWERYSDEVFWNRWVMAGRIYWLARAGRINDAEYYLSILQRTPGNHGWAADAVDIARSSQP